MEAGTSSLTYLSKLRLFTSFSRAVTLSAACSDVLRRLMKAVFRFRDESRELKSEQSNNVLALDHHPVQNLAADHLSLDHHSPMLLCWPSVALYACSDEPLWSFPPPYHTHGIVRVRL